MTSKAPEVISTWTIFDRSTETRKPSPSSHLRISNIGSNSGEVILNYGRCEGGFPVFVVDNAVSSDGEHDVPFRAVYSETREGIDHDTGEHSYVPTHGVTLVS